MTPADAPSPDPVVVAAPAPAPALWVSATGAVGRAGADGGTGGLLGLGGDLPLGPSRRFALEAHVRGGLYADGHIGADALAGLRVTLTPPSPGAALSVFAEGGAALAPAPTPLAWVGADLAFRRDRPLSARIGAAYQLLPAADAAAELRLSLVWRPPGKTAPVATPAPVTAPAAPVVSSATPVAPPDDPRMVWAPHPICAWVPAATVEADLADAPADLPLRVVAPGALPASAIRATAASVVLAPSPIQGGVVIASEYGDRLVVGGATLPVTRSGAVILTAPEGPFSAEITGGGRVATVRGAVVDGFVLWLQVPLAPPETIPFAMASADLDAASLARLARLARDRADSVYEIVGGYSPEGDLARNLALADRRAAAVRDALVAAGVPAASVRVLPAAAAIGTSRVATVTPRPPVAP